MPPQKRSLDGEGEEERAVREPVVRDGVLIAHASSKGVVDVTSLLAREPLTIAALQLLGRQPRNTGERVAVVAAPGASPHTLSVREPPAGTVAAPARPIYTKTGGPLNFDGRACFELVYSRPAAAWLVVA